VAMEEARLIPNFQLKFPVKDKVDDLLFNCSNPEFLLKSILISQSEKLSARFQFLCLVLGIKMVFVPRYQFRGFFHFNQDCFEKISNELQNFGFLEDYFADSKLEYTTVSYCLRRDMAPCPNCWEVLTNNTFEGFDWGQFNIK
jgi:hypothetical protein